MGPADVVHPAVAGDGGAGRDAERGADPLSIGAFARLAGADTFIEQLPLGYDTLLTRKFGQGAVAEPGATDPAAEWALRAVVALGAGQRVSADGGLFCRAARRLRHRRRRGR